MKIIKEKILQEEVLKVTGGIKVEHTISHNGIINAMKVYSESERTLVYKPNTFFDEKKKYLFYDGYNLFIDAVSFYNGIYYTNTGLNYKCSTLRCMCITDSIII